MSELTVEYSQRWLSYFSKVALQTATLSYAKRLQVGVVAVKDRRIIACGFNGTPPGFSNICENADNETLSNVIHAEENLILFSAKHGISLNQCDLFCTHSPCIRCARMILSSGINRFYFLSNYRNPEGLELLRSSGVFVYSVTLS